MFDVAIIGGGPAGSTAGSLLKKYNPDLKVVILEREVFPRDHVGESQLPIVSKVIDEMGCWEKVEAAGFPIKIGATYRWGKSPELWDFEFFPANLFRDEPRPALFEGQRRFTAFQVDRAVYDKILLEHAAELGCEVRQPTKVSKVRTEQDAVCDLALENGEIVEAGYYIDASGHSGILRRALNIYVQAPTTLQNIAIWDYWQNADWAVEIGVGGTRVQVMSLGYGWIWFIPIGPTRTSIGLVIPAEHYKKSGKKPNEIYEESLRLDPRIVGLMQNAVSENKLQTTKDWSFISERHAGANWFLAGESGGFADPILAAGLSLAHVGGKEAAYTILELMRGKEDGEWLRQEFEQRQLHRLRSHVRFADYWYTANAQFSDLQEFTSQIAAENGLDLAPDKAWAWLAQGGFIDGEANIGPAGFSMHQVKTLGAFLTDFEPEPILQSNNIYVLDLGGANWQDLAQYKHGHINRIGSYARAGKVLPLTGPMGLVVDILQRTCKLHQILEIVKVLAKRHENDRRFLDDFVGRIPHALEAMVTDGWVKASYNPAFPIVTLPETGSEVLRINQDPPPPLAPVARPVG